MTTAARRALLICAPFFGYHTHIREGLERRGYAVDYRDDRPSQSLVVKATLRVRPSTLTGLTDAYLAKILDETATRDYDLILVINGRTLTPSFLQALRAAHPRATVVLYVWDALTLYPQILDLADLCDRRFTFDSADAQAHPEFALLPLFYAPPYGEIGARASTTPPAYDIVSICTAHVNRYALLRDLVPALEERGLRVFSFMYLDWLRFAYYRLRSPAFSGAHRREFSFRPLSATQTLATIANTNAVLDINHEAQTGLTMRTIETVGARRKLITTNPHVTTYSLYDPANVLVIDPTQPDLDAIGDFLAHPSRALDDTIYASYSLDHWLDTVTGSEGA